MASPEEFAAECKATARALRRLPADLRRTLGRRVKDEVAEPLAGDIRADWTGPHARVLAAGTKARVSGDPQIVVGGARRVVSGGASVRQLVYGNEFGGGRRVGRVAGDRRRRGYTRSTTQQFPRVGQSAIFGTIHSTMQRTFDRWSAIVDDVLDDIERS